MWNVYLLHSLDPGSSRTYVGATLDVNRRLAQHNGQQSGGAAATAGGTWGRVCYIEGFPHERAALQFEWAWKNTSKKLTGNAMQRRVKALFALLGCDKPTSKADDFQSYVENLEVHWEWHRPVDDYVS